MATVSSAALESRADGHELQLASMAPQLKEMDEAFDKGRTILAAVNWFAVKLAAGIGGLLWLIAIALTIASNGARFLH